MHFHSFLVYHFFPSTPPPPTSFKWMYVNITGFDIALALKKTTSNQRAKPHFFSQTTLTQKTIQLHSIAKGSQVVKHLNVMKQKETVDAKLTKYFSFNSQLSTTTRVPLNLYNCDDTCTQISKTL